MSGSILVVPVAADVLAVAGVTQVVPLDIAASTPRFPRDILINETGYNQLRPGLLGLWRVTVQLRISNLDVPTVTESLLYLINFTNGTVDLTAGSSEALPTGAATTLTATTIVNIKWPRSSLALYWTAIGALPSIVADPSLSFINWEYLGGTSL